MKTPTIQQAKGFTLVELLVVISIIAVLGSVAYPVILKQKKEGDRTQATANIKQIGSAMMAFEQDYGSFPDASTAETVKAKSESDIDLSGDSSNAYFRQLIASQKAPSEKNFFCKSAYTQAADTVISGDKALSKGENGFGYIMNGQSALSTSGRPERALLVAALKAPFSNGQFDNDVYGGKCVTFNMDNSASELIIGQKTFTPTLPDNKKLLDAGPATIWGEGVTPRIALPISK